MRFSRSVQEAASRRRRGHGRHGTHPRVPAAPPSRRRSAARPKWEGLISCNVGPARPSPQLPILRRCDVSDTIQFRGHPVSNRRWRLKITYDWKPVPGSCHEPLRLRSAPSRAIIRVKQCRRCQVNVGPAGQPPPHRFNMFSAMAQPGSDVRVTGSGQPRNSWWDWPLLPLARSKEHRSDRVGGSGESSVS